MISKTKEHQYRVVNEHFVGEDGPVLYASILHCPEVKPLVMANTSILGRKTYELYKLETADTEDWNAVASHFGVSITEAGSDGVVYGEPFEWRGNSGGRYSGSDFLLKQKTIDDVPVVKLDAKGIQWDLSDEDATDHEPTPEQLGLPTNIVIDEVKDSDTGLADELSKMYGYCVRGFHSYTADPVMEDSCRAVRGGVPSWAYRILQFEDTCGANPVFLPKDTTLDAVSHAYDHGRMTFVVCMSEEAIDSVSAKCKGKNVEQQNALLKEEVDTMFSHLKDILSGYMCWRVSRVIFDSNGEYIETEIIKDYLSFEDVHKKLEVIALPDTYTEPGTSIPKFVYEHKTIKEMLGWFTPDGVPVRVLPAVIKVPPVV